MPEQRSSKEETMDQPRWIKISLFWVVVAVGFALLGMLIGKVFEVF
jgi:hypothetical protein